MLTTVDSLAFEDLFSAAYPSDQPGAAVIVRQQGQTVFRKGYGMANLELGVSIRPEMVFRIGSVTKQFTAVAILMLMEEGRLRLDDPLEKFLPDYPIHGHTITIEHLLTHTSGIKSYTSMPEFEKIASHPLSTQEMIDLFKSQPMEFAPGKRWNYNNSGYFLLGVIIEKLSALPYADFLQQRIFDPLGLCHTYYDDPMRIIPLRASGYGKQGEQVVNDKYINMTLPFSAGALASTVDDLAIWDESLYSGKLVSLESLQRAWCPYHLSDGSSTHYGFGWALHEYQGHPWVEHGGGINGFLCQAIRLPAQHAFIAVLTNTTAPKQAPGEIATRAATQLLGTPYQDPRSMEWAANELAQLAGVYEEKPGIDILVTAIEGKLQVLRPDWPPLLFNPVEGERFTNPLLGLTPLYLLRDDSGQVTGLELRNIFGEVDLVAHKTSRSLLDAPASA